MSSGYEYLFLTLSPHGGFNEIISNDLFSHFYYKMLGWREENNNVWQSRVAGRIGQDPAQVPQLSPGMLRCNTRTISVSLRRALTPLPASLSVRQRQPPGEGRAEGRKAAAGIWSNFMKTNSSLVGFWQERACSHHRLSESRRLCTPRGCSVIPALCYRVLSPLSSNGKLEKLSPSTAFLGTSET